MEKQNLRTKLANVMQECHYIQKTGKNNFHGYNYVTSADVLDKVNTALLNNGIITTVIPALLDFREVTTAKGNVEKHATVQVDVTLHDVHSNDTLTLSGIGSGQDTGDKAIMKAETAAIKYAYMLSLCIATGDDPEADERTDQNTATKPSQPSMAVKESKANQPEVPKSKLVKALSTEPKAPTKAKPTVDDNHHCEECGCDISDNVSKYSLKYYGLPLCMDCQKRSARTA